MGRDAGVDVVVVVLVRSLSFALVRHCRRDASSCLGCATGLVVASCRPSQLVPLFSNMAVDVVSVVAVVCWSSLPFVCCL